MSAQTDSRAQSQAQYEKMTGTPIPKLVLTLAAPTVVSMLVSSIYNMADTFFVSQLGTSASGAVGVVFSLMAIIQAVGFTLGMGSGSIISRLLGRQQTQDATRYASTAFFTCFGIGCLLTVGGLLFLNPMMRLLGATETILPYARDYGHYILLAAPFMASSFTMNNILRFEGKASLAMIGLTTGGILNMVLDPLLIFGFRLGIAGAAIATGLSQLISWSILLSIFLLRKTQCRLSLRYYTRNVRELLEILKQGLPSLSRQGLASLASMLLNQNAAVYGDAAVAAMSIVSRICMFVLSVMLGIGQGFQPVCGFNYGAGKYSRVKQAFRFTFLLGEISMSVLALLGFVFAPQLVQLFRNDPQVVLIGGFALRCQCVALALQPLNVCGNMLFQSIGQSKPATFLSCTRQGLFFIPSILVLPRIIGLTGVQITQPLADILSFVVSVPLLLRFFRQLPRDEAGAFEKL